MPKNDTTSSSSSYKFDDVGGASGRGGKGSGRFANLGDSAASQIEGSPLIALGAGIALGAVLGVVLPSSRREKELLAPLGTKITEAGSGAVDRARDISKQKFDEIAGDKVREFFGVTGSGTSE